MPPSDDTAARRVWPQQLRVEAIYLAQLFALTGLAIAQPLLDVFGRSPAEFLFRRTTPTEIVQFAVVVVLVPPLVAWLVAVPFALFGPRVRRIAHLVELFALAALLTVVVLVHVTTLGGIALYTLALVAGAALVLAWPRFRFVRHSLVYLGLAPLAFLALFLFGSQVSDLILESGGTTQPGDLASDDPPSVVYVVLDELPLASVVDRDGSIDAAAYPNLARLAGDGAWFNNATTVAGSTWYASPPLLTGNMPVDQTDPTSADHPDNLLTALAADYRVEAHEAISNLCPPSQCVAPPEGPGGLGVLLGDARSVYRRLISADAPEVGLTTTLAEPTDDHVEPRWDVLEGDQPARYTSFLQGLEGAGPSFHFLQILVPHERWETLPSGIRYPVPEFDTGRSIDDWVDEDAPVSVVRQRHLLKVAYADGLVGGIIDELEAAGTYDDTVIVVTSDHGVAFRPGEPVRATGIGSDPEAILPELMWVPLIIKAPAFAPGTVRGDNVLTTDIAPTIAEIVGLEPDWEMDGRSLVSGPVRDDATKPFYKVEVSGFGIFLDPLLRVPVTRRDEVLALSLDASVPDGDPATRVYRMGPHGSLVGRALDELDVGPPSDLELVLPDVAAFDGVDQSSGEVPALVDGYLATESPPDASVAVVVNGRIGFVSPLFPWDFRAAWITGVVPPDLLAPGRNEVEAYLVRDVDGGPVLERLTVSESGP